MPRRKLPPPRGSPSTEPPPPQRRRSATPAPAEAPRAAAPAPDGGDLLRAFGACRALLDELLRHEDGWVFAAPVDARALGLRDYYTVVADPMDLGTVLRRLERRRYAHPLEFAADVRLTFANALSYNNVGDPVYKSAARLSGLFEDRWRNRLLPSIPPPPPTDDERRATLRDALSRLPADAQRVVAGHLMEEGACLMERKGKVQVDLDKLDAAGLDGLERLIAECCDSHATPNQDSSSVKKMKDLKGKATMEEHLMQDD
ncbi:hypothetical protein ACP4OV_027554 [Aristida adscensionis]